MPRESISKPRSGVFGWESSENNEYSEEYPKHLNKKKDSSDKDLVEVLPHYNYLMNPDLVHSLSRLYDYQYPDLSK